MALAMLLLGIVTSSWAGNFNLPEVADVNDVFAAPAVFKAGAQAPQFTLQPVTVGDVNRDGTMNITDMTELIDALLSNDTYGINGDVDGDGNVNIGDVTDLIDRLLSGTVETRMGTGELASAMNNIYRMLRTAGWSVTGNTHQAFGILAHTLAAEVMGDDMIMGAQGSGWFWFDAAYNVKSRYVYLSWRSYDLWNTYYTCIAEANSIISQKNNITGSTDLVNYYVGQAYALRAYSYFMLSQWFARTYKGHESDPCVPLFSIPRSIVIFRKLSVCCRVKISCSPITSAMPWLWVFEPASLWLRRTGLLPITRLSVQSVPVARASSRFPRSWVLTTPVPAM